MSRIVLHRFPISHFSEKGRALLDFKGLEYDIREYAIGLPQRKIVALSGQRQVPVIEHDGRVVSDSTKIAHYLDEAFPDRRRLIPLDQPRRDEVLALEDRIDRTFGIGSPVLWFDDIATKNDRKQLDLLAIEVYGLPRIGAQLLGKGVGLARALGVGNAFIDKTKKKTRKLLLELSQRLGKSEYLVGNEPTLADVAAVSVSLHFEWPHSRRLPEAVPAGHGISWLVDDPELAPFFEFRRKFYQRYLS